MKNKKNILGSILTLLISVFLLSLNYGIDKKNTTQKAKIKIVKQELNQQQIAYLFSNTELASKCGEGKCGEGKDKKIEKEKDSSKVELKKVNTNSSKTAKSKSAGHKKRDKKKKKKKRKRRNR